MNLFLNVLKDLKFYENQISELELNNNIPIIYLKKEDFHATTKQIVLIDKKDFSNFYVEDYEKTKEAFMIVSKNLNFFCVSPFSNEEYLPYYSTLKCLKCLEFNMNIVFHSFQSFISKNVDFNNLSLVFNTKENVFYDFHIFLGFFEKFLFNALKNLIFEIFEKQNDAFSEIQRISSNLNGYIYSETENFELRFVTLPFYFSHPKISPSSQLIKRISLFTKYFYLVDMNQSFHRNNFSTNIFATTNE